MCVGYITDFDGVSTVSPVSSLVIFVTIGFALPATNREIKRKQNSSDFGVRTTRGKTNSQLAWQAGKELVTIPRYRICYNWNSTGLKLAPQQFNLQLVNVTCTIK